MDSNFCITLHYYQLYANLYHFLEDELNYIIMLIKIQIKILVNLKL